VHKARILELAVLVAVPFAPAASGASTPSRIVFAADLAPSVSGEIYRLDPNGHRVDLSRSPFQDTDPAVSPDGKHVAFLSNRGGHIGVYKVDIDGRGLVTVAPRVAGIEPGSGIAWQPHGDRLAVGGSGTRVAIVRRGHRHDLRVIPRRRRHGRRAAMVSGWARAPGRRPW
jgi:dipeptidyl aminopeptidase/acylaminoacyl peptidase